MVVNVINQDDQVGGSCARGHAPICRFYRQIVLANAFTVQGRCHAYVISSLEQVLELKMIQRIAFGNADICLSIEKVVIIDNAENCD